MNKLKLFAATLLLGIGGNAAAQTDVTATYIQNPGFEDEHVRFLDINTDRGVEKPNGWSVEWYQDVKGKNGMTFNATKMNQDGTWEAPSGKAYFGRMRWENATLYLRQTMSNLRPGSYSLAFKAFAKTGTNGAGEFSVSVAGQTQNVDVEGIWKDYSINFTIAEGIKYATIEIKAKRTSNALFLYGIDEFTLTYDGSTYYNSLITKAQALYENNKDWATGAETLNQAITDNSGKTDVADINAAIEALETAMATFKEANTVDVTLKINNPNFDKNIDGWICTGGDGNGFQRQTSTQTNFAGGFLEKWRNAYTGTNNQKNFDVSQTITNQPKGEYTVKAAILAQMQGGKESLGENTYTNKKHGGPYYIDDEHGVWLYATSGTATSSAWANSENPNFTSGAGGEYKSTTIDVQDGNLTIGFKGVGSENGGTELGTYANWVACDNWTLSYFGSDPTTHKENLEDLIAEAEALLADYTNITGSERTELINAKNVTPVETKAIIEAAIALKAAINTFKAAKSAYDEYAVEKVTADKFGIALDAPKTAAEAAETTHALNVAEYKAVNTDYTTSIELGSWTTEGAKNFSNEHWSGTTHDYLNQNDDNNQGWNSNSWNMSCTQTITLPAGEYVFKAAGRKSTDAYMNLVVTAGETEIGVVSNFPNGNVGLGITTDGRASFDDTNDTFANNNQGYGWQWRFVPFTLTEKTEVTFNISAGAEKIHNWASFGDYTVMAKPNIEASKIAYSQACAKADEAMAGFPVENCAEIAAIAAAKNVSEETIEAYDNATIAVQTATEALNAAKATYQALVNTLAIEQKELKYADPAKYEAIAAAKNIEITESTTATVAETYTAAIIKAVRAYNESNGMAEGLEMHEDYTNSLPAALAGESVPENSDVVNSSNLKIMNNQPATYSDGNKAKYYYDSNIWNSTNKTANLEQNAANLPAGKYLVTVEARGWNIKNFTLTAGNESMALANTGSDGGVYGNGWNDYSLETTVDKNGELNIKVEGVSNNNSAWFSFNNIRLVKIGDLDAVTLDESKTNTIEDGKLAKITLNRTIAEGKWNTLVLPFDLTNDEVKAAFGEDAQVAAFSNTGGANVEFNTTGDGIKANVPVLIKAAAGNEFTFNGYTLAAAAGVPTATGAEYNFVGCYEPTMLEDGDYLLKTDQWWKKEATDSYGVKGFRAFLRANNPKTAAKTLSLVIDGETTGVKLNTVTGEIEGETYNISGQKVTDSYKGIVIKNGKKTVRK